MANDVYRLIVRGNCDGQFWETVQHYSSNVASASDPVTTAGNLITGFISEVEPQLADMLAVDNEITGYSAKRVNNGGSPTVMRPITPVVGTVAGTSATAAVAYCIVNEYSHLSAFKTGRWFIPGIPETYLVGNGYAAGGISSSINLINANATFTEGGDIFHWGTWSRTYSLFFLPTYVHLSSKVGIQRRRLTPV